MGRCVEGERHDAGDSGLRMGGGKRERDRLCECVSVSLRMRWVERGWKCGGGDVVGVSEEIPLKGRLRREVI